MHHFTIGNGKRRALALPTTQTGGLNVQRAPNMPPMAKFRVARVYEPVTIPLLAGWLQ